MKDDDRILASRRLSRMKLCISDKLMQCTVIWCRCAFSAIDGLHAAMNRHTFYELHYALKGAIRVTYGDGHTTMVAASEFVLIPPRCDHCVETLDRNSEKFVCAFTLQSISEFVTSALGMSERRTVFKESPAMRPLLDLILVDAFDRKAAAQQTTTNLLECFLIEVLRRLDHDRVDSGRDAKLFENDLRMETARQFIESQIARNITGEDVARHLNISLRHLNRLATRHFGKPMNRLIAESKMTYIKELLNSPDYTLETIAEMTGFSSEYAMNRFFKQNEGMAVGIFRRSLRM